jgi:hypothetical protein
VPPVLLPTGVTTRGEDNVSAVTPYVEARPKAGTIPDCDSCARMLEELVPTAIWAPGLREPSLRWRVKGRKRFEALRSVGIEGDDA